MKLAKSLLLGSAAGLFAVAGAQAADLPVRKAAPVEYVRVCTAYGAGFFYIPGTDTCLRISGFIRAEYTYYEPSTRLDDATGFGARGRINFDARTATEFGLLRTFVRFEERTRTGSYGGIGPYVNNSSFSLDKGFIQFGGLTAGRVQSLYDFYAHDIEYISATIGSDQSTQVLAYTAQFGGGFSATLSIEDPTVRQQKAGPFSTFSAPAGFIAPIGFATAGTRMPDIVGVLRADQAWGSAQLSAAAHQIRAANLVGLPVPGFGTVYDTPDTDYGFAIQGGVKVNLPMLAPGDALWLQAAYAQGAPSYAGLDYLGFTGTAQGRTVGRLRNIFIPVTDAYVNPFNGDLEKSESWSVQGAFLHYWLPTLRQGVFGSYGQIRYSGPSAFINPTTGIVNGFPDANTWNIGSNLIWSPVKDLDLGVEVVYQKVNLDHGIAPYVSTGGFTGTGFAAGLPATYGLKNEDAWSGRVRIERDF